MTTKKYDKALSENPGKIITVTCYQFREDFDIRSISDEEPHPGALHVIRFTCPKGHRSEARRVFKDS